MLRPLREKFLENLEVYQEQARTWWSGLAAREKWVLIVASSSFALVLLLAAGQQVFFFVQSSTQRGGLADQLAQAEEQIQRVRSLQFLSRRYDSQVSMMQGDFNFEDEARNRATRSGIEIESIRRSASRSLLVEPQALLFEVKVSQGSNLEQSLRFLDSLQSILGVRLINLSLAPLASDKDRFEIDALFALSEELQ